MAMPTAYEEVEVVGRIGSLSADVLGLVLFAAARSRSGLDDLRTDSQYGDG